MGILQGSLDQGSARFSLSISTAVIMAESSLVAWQVTMGGKQPTRERHRTSRAHWVEFELLMSQRLIFFVL